MHLVDLDATGPTFDAVKHKNLLPLQSALEARARTSNPTPSPLCLRSYYTPPGFLHPPALCLRPACATLLNVRQQVVHRLGRYLRLTTHQSYY